MDLYSTLNSLAPKSILSNFIHLIVNKFRFLFFRLVSYLSRDYSNDSSLQNNDLPSNENPVFILGKKYSSLHGDNIVQDSI